MISDVHEERHAGLTNFVLMVAFAVPAVLVAVLVGGALLGGVAGGWIATLSGAMLVFALIFGVGGLLRMGPLEFRIDRSGVQIGRLGARARERVTPIFQSRGRFDAGWDAILSAEVVADRARIEALADIVRSTSRNAPRRDVPNPYGRDRGVGVGAGQFFDLWSKAYLVVTLDRTRTDLIRQPVLISGRRGQGHLDTGLWFVPTRHPRRVQQTLATIRAGGVEAAGRPGGR